MKQSVILFLLCCLVGGQLSFQKPNPQQFIVVGKYEPNQSGYYDLKFMLWDNDLHKNIEIVGTLDMLKYANSRGWKVVSIYLETTGAGYKDQIVFILE